MTTKPTLDEIINALNLEDLLDIRKGITDLIKKKSKQFKSHYKKHKKLRDSKLHFIFNPLKGQFKFATFKSPTFKTNEDLNDTVTLNVPQIVWKSLTPLKDSREANIYIVYLPKKLPKVPIMNVGEVRKQSTGDYRSIFERFGYGSNDHGGQERAVLMKKIKPEETATRIDKYLAQFDFEMGQGYVFLTTGVEKDLIRRFKEESTINNQFVVINK